MSKSSENVKAWRKATKERMVTSMGGKCQCCGYDRCNESLDFHHINPDEKELPLGSIRANPKSWLQIVHELRKCILVCRNCHGEIHYGKRSIPTEYAKFDESYVDYKHHPSLCNECSVCGNQKPIHSRYCSLDCSRRGTRVDWSQFDLPEMIKTMSISEIAELVDLSSAGIIKRMKKLGIKSVPKCQRIQRNFAPFVKPAKTDKEPQIKISDIDPNWRHRPNISNRKTARPSKEHLEKLIWEKSLLGVGKVYGVTDNTIRQWATAYGIPLPPRGYRQRRRAGYSHEESLVSQKQSVPPKKFITKEIAEQAYQLVKNGMSYRKAAETFGFKHWGMQQAFERYGLESIKHKVAVETGNDPVISLLGSSA